MIKCVISVDNQDVVKSRLAGSVNEAIKANEPFGLKEFMTELYDYVDTKITDEDKKHATALSYSALVPELLTQLLNEIDTAVGDLSGIDFDFNKLYRLHHEIQDKGLTVVEEFIEKQANDVQDLIDENKDNIAPGSIDTSPQVPQTTEEAPQGLFDMLYGFIGQLMPDIVSIAEKTAFATSNIFPPTAFFNETAGQERNQVPNQFKEKVGRNIIKQFHEQGVTDSSEMKLKVDDRVTAVYLTARSVASFDPNDFYPEDAEAVEKDINKEGVFIVLTNKHGEPIRFDENGNATKDNGKIAYYRLPNPDSRFINGKLKLTSYDEKRIKNLAESAYDGNYKVAKLEYVSQLRTLQSLRNYVNENKIPYDATKPAPIQKEIMFVINGGTRGYGLKDSGVETPIRELTGRDSNNNLSTEVIKQNFRPEYVRHDNQKPGAKSGFTYFDTEGYYEQPIEIERPAIKSVKLKDGTMLVDKLISLIVDDIVDKHGKPLTLTARRELLEFYFKTGSDTIRLYEREKGGHDIKFFDGRSYRTTSPETREAARKALRSYFTTFGPARATDKKANLRTKDFYQSADRNKVVSLGEGKNFAIDLPKMHINGSGPSGQVSVKKYLDGIMPDINLHTDENGQVIMTPVKVVDENGVQRPYYYRDFIYDHYAVRYRLGPKNEIRKYDTYFTFAPTKDTLNTVFGQPTIDDIENTIEENPIEDVIDDDEDIPLLDVEPTAVRKRIKDVNEDNEKLDKSGETKAIEVKASLKQLEEAKKWYEEESGLKEHIDFEALFDIANINSRGVATFELSGITLYKGSDYSDLYHEAWHVFSQGFLTKEQKKALYEEVGKKSGSFIDYRGDQVFFRNATEKQLEEYIAEDFRTYMLKGAPVKGAPVRNTIFRKILDFFKTIFGLQSEADINADNTLKELYGKLRIGNLKEYTFSQENFAFTRLNKGIRATNTKSVVQELNYQQSLLVKESVDALLSDWVDFMNSNLDTEDEMLRIAQLELNLKSDDFTDAQKNEFDLEIKAAKARISYDNTARLFEKDPNDLTDAYSYVLLRISQQYNNKVLEYKAEKAKKEPNQVTLDRLKKNFELLWWMRENFGDVDNINSNLVSSGDSVIGVIGYHMFKSEELFGEEIELINLDDLSEEERTEVAGRRFEAAGNELPMEKLAAKEVLYLLGSLQQTDKNGKKIENELGFGKLVPFQEAWNRTARALQDTLKADDMWAKLVEEKDEYVGFQQLLKKLGPVKTNKLEPANIWTKFWSTFNATRIPLIQMTVEKKDAVVGGKSVYNSSIGEALNSNSRIARHWEAIMQTNPNLTYAKRDKDGYYIDLQEVLDNFTDDVNAPKNQQLIGREMQFLHALGMKIVNDPNVIKQLHKNGDITWIFRQVKFLNTYGIKLRNFDDLKSAYIYKSYDYDSAVKWKSGQDIPKGYSVRDSMNSRVNHVVSAHARYADDVSNFMVSNSEGNTQYEFSLNNSMTVLVNSINNAKTYQEFIAARHTSHMNIDTNVFAKASTWLNSIFVLDVAPNHPDYGTRRIVEGDVVKIHYTNLSGVFMTDDTGDASVGAGIASAKADELTKMILDFHLTVQLGRPELMRHADKKTSYSAYLRHIHTKVGTSAMYINNADFLEDPEIYNEQAYDMLVGHIAAEFSRIKIMRGLKNLQDIDYNYWKDGQQFVTFDDVLIESKSMLMDLIAENEVDDLEAYLEETPDLKEVILADITNYFDRQTERIKDKFEKNPFIATNVRQEFIEAANKSKKENITRDAIETSLIRSYVYNTWINNLETIVFFYGDLAMYNHKKEEFHKRNAGMGSTGTLIRTDDAMKQLIDQLGRKTSGEDHGYDLFNGTFKTAVIRDPNVNSVYYDEYHQKFVEYYREKGMSKKNAENKADKMLKNYMGMEEGDGQAWISFDSYRILKTAEGTWGPKQEDLYNKIARGDQIAHKDVIHFFPVLKLQYFGPLQNTMEGLPVTAFHKYSIMPLIPTVIEGTNLQKLHEKMIREGVDYVVNRSGSKVGNITKNTKGEEGKSDLFYTADREIIDNEPFTPNIIHLEYLKNQLKIAPELKNKTIFSTQLRKLIEDGLMEFGVPTDYLPTKPANKRIESWNALIEKARKEKNPKLLEDASDRYKLLIEYERNIEELTKLKKQELLDEIGWTMQTVDGEDFVDGDIESLIRFVKKQLTRQDLAEHEIDFLKTHKGRLVADLSLSLSAEQIEKVLNALVIKRLIKQKVGGEGFIQVANSMFESSKHSVRYRNATKKDLTKHGSNDLPTYRDLINLDERYAGMNKSALKKVLKQKEWQKWNQAKNWVDSKRSALEYEINYLEAVIAGKEPIVKEINAGTTAMKVKVALQGEFIKLLGAMHNDGTRIRTIDRLNDMIQNEEWLNTGRNRDMVTMVGVRIPVQGHNSMEFMEVYEFLPAEAGNIIIPPAEIVAKSGSDFDIDKLNIMIPNLKRARKGEFARLYDYTEVEAKKAYRDYVKAKTSPFYKTAGVRIDRLTGEREIKDIGAFDELLNVMGIDTYDETPDTIEELLLEGDEIMSEEVFIRKLIGTKAVENKLIYNLRDILELPENFVNLVTPNSTDIVKDIADDLQKDVQKYNPFETTDGKGRTYKKDGKDVQMISPTRVLEIEYNLYKHSTNNIGMQTLGLAAVDNTYNTLFNRIGFYMNPTAGTTTKEYNALMRRLKKGETLYGKEKDAVENYHKQTLFLPHNTLKVDKQPVISLSHTMDANNEYRISEIINQLLNGWLDIAKDTWIFNLQGNKEVTPVMLFLLQSGVPVKDVMYFISQPMVRLYIEEQQMAKSTFAEPLGKSGGNPNLYKNQARKEILTNPKYGINVGGLVRGKGGMLKTINTLSNQQINKKVLNTKGYFGRNMMRENITKYANDSEKDTYKFTDTDRAMFLHYLQAEEMAMSVRDVKLNMNFDTTKSETLFAAQNKILAKEKLKKDARIPIHMVDKLLTDSPIGSFYIQPFQLALWKDLFSLRNHPAFNDWLLKKFGDRKIQSDINDTFGDDELFANNLRNDFVSFIFQNYLREFDVNAKKYANYDLQHELYKKLNQLDALSGSVRDNRKRIKLEREIEEMTSLRIEQVKSLTQGISRGFIPTEVKEARIRNVLYVDPRQLNKDFKQGLFYRQDYRDRGFATVNPTAFSNVNEYHHFVYEREVLRTEKPMSEIKKDPLYISIRSKNILNDSDDQYQQREKETNEEYYARMDMVAYEEYLRDTALTNIFNHWHLFKSENTYADQFEILKNTYDLSDYKLVEYLQPVTSTDNTDFVNLKLRDNFLSGDVYNTLHENLKDLMDPSVMKVKDPVANKIITDFFKKFSTYAFLQSGMNTKSSFSLTRLVPYDIYLRMMKEPAEAYMKHLDMADDSKISSPILDRYYELFIANNGFRNRGARIRGKNYTIQPTLESFNEALDELVALKKLREKNAIGSKVFLIYHSNNKVVTATINKINQFTIDGEDVYKVAVKDNLNKKDYTFVVDERGIGVKVSIKGFNFAGYDYTYAKAVRNVMDEPVIDSDPMFVEDDHGSFVYPTSALDIETIAHRASKSLDKVYVYNYAKENQFNAVKGDALFYDQQVPNSIGLTTLLAFAGPGSQITDDENGVIRDEIKRAIDADIEAMHKTRHAGQSLAFLAEGYGQYMIGVDLQPVKVTKEEYREESRNPRAGKRFTKERIGNFGGKRKHYIDYYIQRGPSMKRAIAKDTFLYLSKRLLEFDYINPNYLALKEGRQIIQEQQVMDDETALDLIKYCRSL